jgi:hypothetical protein
MSAASTQEKDGGGGSSTVLAGLFQAIVKAITQGHGISESQHLNQIRRYSDAIEGSEGRRPKTLTLEIDTPGEEVPRQVEVPLLALAPPTSLALKELQMEFQVRLVGVDAEEGEVEVRIGEEGKAELEAAMATVKVTVEGTEPPDSVSRLIELLTQQMI